MARTDDDSNSLLISVPCIVKLHPTISDEDVTRLKCFLENLESRSGCQLDVEEMQFDDSHVLCVNANLKRLMCSSEDMGVVKEYKDGTMRELCLDDVKNFKNSYADDFLKESEVVRVIIGELSNIRFKDGMVLPDGVRCYQGENILHSLLSNKIVTDIFPLHNRDALSKLSVTWFKKLRPSFKAPLNEIHEYFGDTIGFYFAFLNFYTTHLFYLFVFSICYWLSRFSYDLFAVENNWLVSLGHMVWSVIFVKCWKRESQKLSYKWGCDKQEQRDIPRIAFKGDIGVNDVTGKQEPIYPNWKRLISVYCVSSPIVGLSILLATMSMFYYVRWESYIIQVFKDDPSAAASLYVNLPSIVYSIFVIIADSIFRKLAEFLTELENHRLESSFQNHLIVKILLFTFTNNFLILFYIAFYQQNIPLLQKTLRNLLLVHMFVSQALESVFPYVILVLKSSRMRTTECHNDSGSRRLSLSFSSTLKFAMTSKQQTIVESKKEKYPGTFDDYLELWLQFGYLVMFSSVYPTAIFYALVNNIIEKSSDAFKMTYVYRRPVCQQTDGIGVWLPAFDLLSYIAIVSNLGLHFQTNAFSTWFNQNLSELPILAVFFASEHLLLICRWFVANIIPDVPDDVRNEREKVEYYANQALKKQRRMSTVLYRKY